ncbi:unnamed protein product [Trifolium pratense]|uniref:Uncharacterized protein n=1 Tax=Trifolium pratense TaxID=57577 RepID=A0ACB0K8J9_TRIPR|nr:unnamed protein product [Trifolium pratense]
MLRAQINGFRQKDGESLFEAWERYKDMMRLCPHHGLEQWLIIHTFYNGLLYNTRLTIDAAAGGALMDKPYQEATQLIENMAQNHYQWGSERAAIEKSQTKGGMYEVSGIDHVNAKIEALSQKIESLTLSPAATIAAVQPNCELCGIPGHITSECQLLAGLDQAKYVQENPYPNTYNPGWKNHPSLSYKNNNALFAPSTPPGFQNQIGAPVAPVTPEKSNFELMMENFVLAQTQQNKEFMNQNIHTNELIKQLANKIDSISTHNKMLETQISQVAQQQAATAALAGTLLGQLQPNPKGHVNAITLRSGRELEDPVAKRVRARDLEKNVEKDSESVTDKDTEREPIVVKDRQTPKAKEFSGSPTEDPNLHLSVFVQYADTIKANGVEPEAIRLRLFPFSLRDRARAWLQALPSNSITTWNELKKQFLARYFPPSKTAMLRAQINGFRQKDGESLFEAWERYKDMMRLCPHHGLEQWLIIHTFYNGLLYNTRLTIDAAAGGALMDKPYQEATQLIENMAQNHYQWGSERAAIEKSQTKGGMYEVSGIDHVNAKIEALSQKIESLTLSPAATIAAVQPNCELCGIPGHITSECQLLAGLDQAKYVQENPYPNTYNPGWKNHPSLSYKNNNALFAPSTPPGFQNQIGAPVAPVTPEKSNFELMMENFVLAQTQQNKEFMNQNIHTNELIKQLANKIDSISTHNKMLETQISQVAQQQAATAALAGTLLGQLQPNPKGHVNAITLRSGRELEDPVAKRVRARDLEKNVEKDSESVTDKDTEREPIVVKDRQTPKAKEVYVSTTLSQYCIFLE